ncbi:MAG: hypothetical protein WA921_03645 [Ahrensia sp.]
MTKRRTVMVLLVVGVAAWLAKDVDYGVLMSRLEPIAAPTALVFVGIGLIALIAGVAALFAARRRSHAASMANDDALRVLRMQQRKTAQPEQTPVIINTPPLAADTAKHGKPASAAEKTQDNLAPPTLILNAAKDKITLSDGVYFQPVVHVPSGTVTGFGVFRQAITGKSRSHFIRHAGHLSKAAQVKLEADSVMTATSEARRVLQSANNSGNAKAQTLWIDVPVSEALLSDRVKLQSVLNLMSAHPALKRSIRLLVDARALSQARKSMLDALKLVQHEGVTMALNLAEAGRLPIKPELLAWFDALYVNKSDVQHAVMGQQAEAAVGQGKNQPAPEATSLLGSLQEARRLKMLIIATNVVCEPDAVDMLAEDIEHMSGALFGEPRAIKANLLATSKAPRADQFNKTG